MSRYRRAHSPGGTYFFTVVSYRRQPILCDIPIRNALRDAIQRTRQRYPFTIDAWVLMPDHLHCIWTLPEGDADFSKRWAKIKRDVSLDCGDRYRRVEWITESKKKHRESTIWQRRFWEHQVADQDDFRCHMDYLHYNPVKHELCEQPSQWPYSSLHRYLGEGVYPKDWTVQEPRFEGLVFGEV